MRGSGPRAFAVLLLAGAAAIAASAPGHAGEDERLLAETFVRGDTDGDGHHTITDAVRVFRHLFVASGPRACLDAMDADDSGEVRLTDGIVVLLWLFADGIPPRPPFPDCGVDPTPDDLACPEHAACREAVSDAERLRAAYGRLETVAGRGTVTGAVNAWDPAFEGGPASEAELSRPHIALADDAGNIYIADKEAHAVRVVRPDGSIHTWAGTGAPGDDGDSAGPATERRLREPNGLWVRGDGVVYILDTGNGKVRRVSVGGTLTTLFSVPGLETGRGLWVAPEEDLAFVASREVLFRWSTSGGVRPFAAAFEGLGNLAVDEATGDVLVTDRDGHRVWRVPSAGERIPVAGNGTPSGGGDGQPALETGLDQVRGIWPAPGVGGWLLGTQRGSQVWYLDPGGRVHLFLDGAPGAHAGDGGPFDAPGPKVSEVRAITTAPSGDLLVTENDAGYVRRIEFLGTPVP